jgi:hypothetical protein
MRKRGLENTAFGLIGVALLFSPSASAIEVRVGGVGVSLGNGGVRVGGGGVGVSIGNGGLSAEATIGGNQVSVEVPVEPALVEPPAAASGQAVFPLPVALLPRQLCRSADSDHCDADAPDEGRDTDSLAPQFIVPTEIVAACRKGIINAAKPYDPVEVDVVGAGRVQRVEEGGQIAPLVVRIIYDREGGYETREARVRCYVDSLGNAVSLT